jgi:hypothetical protein
MEEFLPEVDLDHFKLERILVVALLLFRPVWESRRRGFCGFAVARGFRLFQISIKPRPRQLVRLDWIRPKSDFGDMIGLLKVSKALIFTCRIGHYVIL